MKRIAIILTAFSLAACNALGGISPDLIASTKNAAASCVRVKSLVMGDAVFVTANDVKGALVNGSITVNPDSCAMTINNAPGAAVTPVVTTTTGSSTVTTVTAPR